MRSVTYECKDNASALHKKVGEILHHSIFSSYKISQEYPVCKINPTYFNKAHKFDWVIHDLNLVIECHGQQHYISCFFHKEGGLSHQKFRDIHKATAAVDAGYTYIEIPYTDINLITEQYILNKYKEYLNNNKIINYVDKKNQILKEYRKKQYKLYKETMKNRRE